LIRHFFASFLTVRIALLPSLYQECLSKLRERREEELKYLILKTYLVLKEENCPTNKDEEFTLWR
jgi:hypothetical protein